eukprot:1358656-Amorphochlora_amoeboformis.AAC.1
MSGSVQVHRTSRAPAIGRTWVPEALWGTGWKDSFQDSFQAGIFARMSWNLMVRLATIGLGTARVLDGCNVERASR